MKKLIISTVVILICMVCIAINANALSSTVAPAEVDTFADLLDVATGDITVELLYDLNDEPAFLLADINTGVFAVMFREAEIISETGESNPYGSATGKKYYGGPMSYIEANNDVYTCLLTGNILDDLANQERY